MITAKIKKPLVLSVLFFLPVLILLFLYLAEHNYNTLDIIKKDLPELTNFVDKNGEELRLENHLTVLGFFGETPMEDATPALNLKELVYDKCYGFKHFQVIILVPESSNKQVELLEKQLNQYEFLNSWKFGYGSPSDVLDIYKSLKTSNDLGLISLDYFRWNNCLKTSEAFIIDKERHQRGRLDDRTKAQKEENFPIYSMPSYNVLEVAELKNKMSEDMRILFTEYRQKRKGNFTSTNRRAQDLKQ